MHWRRIVVDGREWRWSLGKRAGHAEARCGAVKIAAPITEVTGLSWDEVERGKWKRYFSVTPQQVADWIRSKGPDALAPDPAE